MPTPREKIVKPAKEKKPVISNGLIDAKSAASFPMIKLIDERIRESVPKEIIDRVIAVTSKRQIICSTYPYDKCIKTKAYEKEARYLQIELVKMQAWIQKNGRQGRDAFRRARCRGQGRHDQALHRVPQPARRARCRARQAFRTREGPVVFPALCRAAADRG